MGLTVFEELRLLWAMHGQIGGRRGEKGEQEGRKGIIGRCSIMIAEDLILILRIYFSAAVRI